MMFPSGRTIFPIYTLSPFPVSRVWDPAHSYQLSVLQNYSVDNLPADKTLPSPEVFIRPVKLVVNHDTIAAKTLHHNTLLRAIEPLYIEAIWELNKASDVFYG